MRVFEKILCPVDLSESSVSALQWTEYLSKQHSSEVAILHSVEIREFEDPFISDYGTAVSKAQSALKEMVLPLTISYELMLGTRAASAEIPIRAERSKATTILMSTHGLKGFAHKLVGSTTEEVIRHSRYPIITISPKCAPRPDKVKGRILLPVEDIKKVPSAWSVFRQIVQETKSSATILHVVGFKEPMYESKSEIIPLNTFALEAEDTNARLKSLAEAVIGKDDTTETAVDFGDIPEGILKEASTGKYDFILMGAKKERFLSRFVDSVVYSVISQSPIPVITIRTV